MVFEKIHRPLFAESKHVDFPNNNSVSTSYNGAFCKVRNTLLLSRRLCNFFDRRTEVTPLYKLYKYVPPHRVGFLRRLSVKTGIHFAHFGLESGMAFEGTTGVYDGIYRFNSKLACVAAGPRTRLLRRRQFQMSEKEREICEFEMDLKCFLVCALF